VILAFGSLSVGTLQEKPTSIKASSTSFRRGVGAVRLDLSTLTTASTKEFTASVGVGTVELVLPKSSTTTATVTARTGLGSVVGGDKATIAAGDKYVFGQGPNSISIDLRVGIGTIRILSSP
jgi:hypothetical protein